MRSNKFIVWGVLLSFGLVLSCGQPTASKNNALLEEESLVSSKEQLSNSPTQHRDTLKDGNPFLSKKKTQANFIKNHRVADFEVPIHLTGAFAWSSEQEQRALYKERRPPIHIMEIYPGVISYTKWVHASPESNNVSTENHKLEFYDDKGNLIKEFGIDKENPYLQKYPDLVNNFYNAEGRLIKETANESQRDIHFRNSTNSVYVDESGFSQVIYTLYNSNQDGNMIDFETTFIILDTLGNELNRLEEKELFINDTYITPDGKFLALCTGGMIDINDFGNDMNGHRDMGIRIYNTRDMSLIYTNKGTYSDGVSGGWDNNGWIDFRLKNNMSDETNEGTRYFINPITRTEYSRVFTYKELDIISEKLRKDWRKKNLREETFKEFNFKIRNF